MKLKKVLSRSLATLIIASSFSVSNAEESIDFYAGKDREETSILTANAFKNTEPGPVVLVSGKNPGYILASLNLVKKYNARLIYVNNKMDLIQTLKDANTNKVYIVGQSNEFEKNGVFGTKVKSQIALYFNKYSFDKAENSGLVKTYIENNDAYLACNLILKDTGYKEVVVASQDSYPDALSAVGLMSNNNLGLQLRPKKDFSNFHVKNIKVVYTVGGPNTLPEENGIRLYGKDRYETNKVVNSKLNNIDTAIVASGREFPDALCSFNLLNIYNNSSVVLSNKKIEKGTLEYLKDKNVSVVGGIIGKEVVSDIAKSKNISNINLFGKTAETMFGINKPEIQIEEPKVPTTKFKITDFNNKKFEYLIGPSYESIEFRKNGSFEGRREERVSISFEMSYNGKLAVKKKIDDYTYDLSLVKFDGVNRGDLMFSWFETYYNNYPTYMSETVKTVRLYLPGKPVRDLEPYVNLVGVPVENGRITKRILANTESFFTLVEK